MPRRKRSENDRWIGVDRKKDLCGLKGVRVGNPERPLLSVSHILGVLFDPVLKLVSPSSEQIEQLWVVCGLYTQRWSYAIG